MAAYNKVNGIPMTENVRLLRDVLKNEWGFDGVVTSDWHAARSTAADGAGRARPGHAGSGRALGRHSSRSAVADGAVTPRNCWTTRCAGCSGWPAGSAR